MGWLITTMFLLSTAAPAPDMSVVPSRDLALPLVIVQNIDPVNFDLLDVREEMRGEDPKNVHNENPHTFFIVKHHIGGSVGYDNTVVHGSVGLYMTVAEWGRWNFGVPSLGLGWGRYPIYDRTQGLAMMKSQPTVFVSIASIHYRVSYLQSLGMNWYINLEQVYDLRYNMTGSQFGISLSSK
ncbi:MAG TPA: hypothetical protein VH583_11600 [Vicinamibacterales bacterium]|jgi:hypothetical protein